MTLKCQLKLVPKSDVKHFSKYYYYCVSISLRPDTLSSQQLVKFSTSPSVCQYGHIVGTSFSFSSKVMMLGDFNARIRLLVQVEMIMTIEFRTVIID